MEAVTVSCGYGDFLEVTLAENLPLLDDLVVITTPDDRETQDACRRYSVRYVMSEDGSRVPLPRVPGNGFNKARLINRAFDQLGLHNWVLHLDADIVLPRQFRRLLDWAHLDPRCIYGADRRNLVGWEEWARFKTTKHYWDCHSYECFHKPKEELPVGHRWCSSIHGYVPIGCFQLFHGSQLVDRGMHVRRYPIEHGSAARTDVQFALQWDRRYRQLLPEVAVLHLESQGAPMGSNWNGRKTRRFAPREGQPGKAKGAVEKHRHIHLHCPPCPPWPYW